MATALITELAVGTPGYYAPEMVNSESEGYTAQIDMWTFGLVLAQLVMNSSKVRPASRVVYASKVDQMTIASGNLQGHELP